MSVDTMALPPSPPSSRVMQTLRYATKPLPLAERCASELGPNFTLRPFVPTRPMVFVSELELMKEFCAAPTTTFVTPEADMTWLFGEHATIFMQNGEAHQRQRKILMSVIGDAFANHATMAAELVDAMIASWPLGKPLSAQHVASGFMSDYLARLLFDVTPPMSDKLRASGDYLADFESRPADMLRIVMKKPPTKATLEAAQEYRQIGLDRVREVRAKGAEGESFLARACRAKDKEGLLPDEVLRDELIGFFIAGKISTTIAMAWCFHGAFEHPEHVARIREEAEKAGVVRGRLDPKSVKELTFTEAFVKECLRVYPTNPFILRRVPKPTTLGGLTFTPDVDIMVAGHLVHQRPDVWGDPQTFRPERFLGKSYRPHEYLPFGLGNRRCTGAAFVVPLMALYLARIITRCDLAPVPGGETTRWYGVDLGPARGVRFVPTAKRE